MKISGTKLAEKVVEELKQDIAELKEKNITPGIAIITVGHDGPWKVYVKAKQKIADNLGISIKHINLSKADTDTIIEEIKKQNSNENIHGIIVQRPIPKELDREKINNAIDIKKDIDGFRKDSIYEAPVWLAVKKILQKISQNHDLSGWLNQKSITVIGKGETGGGPVISNLKKIGINPEIIDSKTKNPNKTIKRSDIVISATGKKSIINHKNIKIGVILIGIGTHIENGKLFGDYNEEEIRDIASFYTCTPGGVGPLNLAFLFKNLIKAAETN